MAQMYADMALSQRTHYGAYLDTGQHMIASASPELFFQWAGDRLLTRPMKGTAARGRTQAEDQERVRALVNSAKERAENVIVVDLLRNDVSRVATAGSVSVPALCVPERYETLWQLTSDVSGTVPEETSLVDVFRALFPSGSITGAPKQRTMEVIRDVETSARGCTAALSACSRHPVSSRGRSLVSPSVRWSPTGDGQRGLRNRRRYHLGIGAGRRTR